MNVIRHHFSSIDSTNTWAKRNVENFDPNQITLITANQQTAGIGRFKRKWESPPNNLYATFCWFIDKQRYDIGNIPQLLSLATAKTLEALNFVPQLKWPNDVLLSEKKVAGILCETTTFPYFLCIILGIGININMPLENLQTIDRPATSLAVEANRQFSVEVILDKLQESFIPMLDLFLKKGFEPFLNNYRKRMSVWINKPIKFHDNKTIWNGLFHSINDDGSLNLILETGELKMFLVGEILW
jgi:BirA family transcriptional regulator, biotin operon repressor / biotin---[acetyl-CoA-carboxylase] ligase